MDNIDDIKCSRCGNCCSYYFKTADDKVVLIPILKCRYYDVDTRLCTIYDTRPCPKGSKMIEAALITKDCPSYVEGSYRTVASPLGCLRAIREMDEEYYNNFILKNFKIDFNCFCSQPIKDNPSQCCEPKP